MSDFAARQALERLHLREVALASGYNNLMSDLKQLAAASPEEQQKKFMEQRRAEMCEAYGLPSQDQRKPFAFSQGIAIIPICGTLINRFGGSYSWITGYNFIRRQLALALGDPDVKGIIFDVNSYGGEAAGCFELSDDIFEARGKKPMIAVIDSNCYSAGYALASAADKIIITPSGGAGSIGVVAMHVDMSKALDDYGYKITFIHFGDHKVDGNPYEALSDEVKADIQKSVNTSGEKFVSLVARNRNIDAAKVKATQARVYRAEEAKSLGLIDTIATPSQAVQVFFDELTGSDSQPGKEDAMTDTTKPDAAAQAAAAAADQQAADIKKAASDAVVAEKARISGILSCDEAKGKGKLANHLAMNTSMSIDEAKAMLAVAAAEAATTTAAAPNALVAAMAATGGGPRVGGEGGEGGEGDGAESASARILRSQQGATGLKLVAK